MKEPRKEQEFGSPEEGMEFLKLYLQLSKAGKRQAFTTLRKLVKRDKMIDLID